MKKENYNNVIKQCDKEDTYVLIHKKHALCNINMYDIKKINKLQKCT